jgi:hypothetical protein
VKEEDKKVGRKKKEKEKFIASGLFYPAELRLQHNKYSHVEKKVRHM